MFDAQLRRVDEFQQKHSWAGFPNAVLKKFGEDQGGNLAAVLSYYAFFSLFPLLLVFVTVLAFALNSAPGVKDKFIKAVTHEFNGLLTPESFKGLQGHWWVLIVGVALALYSGLAVANAAQNAFNAVYNVAYADRPDFIHRVGRSVVIVVVGFLLLATTVVSGYLNAPLGPYTPAIVSKVTGFAVTVALDIGLFVFLFRWLTARKVTWRQALPGGLVAAIAFALLQLVATTLITHYTKTAKGGAKPVVASVIGILSWVYLQARITLLCAELNMVRDFRLWPRAMQPKPPGLEADRKAYELHAEQARFQKQEQVDVEYPKGDPTSAPVRPGDARREAAPGGEGAPSPTPVHSSTAVHRGRVVALVVGTGLAAWVHGRRTAPPSAGDKNEHQPRNVRR